jgi:hypothetical protein
MDFDQDAARRVLDELELFGWRDDVVLGEGIGARYRVRVPRGNLYQMSQDLLLLDRELRRAALWISDGTLQLSASNPYENSVKSVGPGSLWANILATGGVVHEVLLSDPIQLFATAHTLVSIARPSQRHQADSDMPTLEPNERVLFDPQLVDEVTTNLFQQNPDRPIRVEFRTDAVIIEAGARRRWWRRR